MLFSRHRWKHTAQSESGPYGLGTGAWVWPNGCIQTLSPPQATLPSLLEHPPLPTPPPTRISPCPEKAPGLANHSQRRGGLLGCNCAKVANCASTMCLALAHMCFTARAQQHSADASGFCRLNEAIGLPCPY